MDEQGFLATIAADPFDRMTRLVYADWLEEQGDQRGELIRLHEQIRDLRAWDADYQAQKQRRDNLAAGTTFQWRRVMGLVAPSVPLCSQWPDDPPQRWQLFDEFKSSWIDWSPYVSPQGELLRQQEEALGLVFPTALHEWYRRMPRQMNLLPAGELTPEGDGRLTFYRHSRRRSAALRVDEFRNDDPAVWDAVGGRMLADSITQFAFQDLLQQVNARSRIVFGGAATPQQVALVRSVSERAAVVLPGGYGQPIELWEADNLLFWISKPDELRPHVRISEQHRGDFDAIGCFHG